MRRSLVALTAAAATAATMSAVHAAAPPADTGRVAETQLTVPLGHGTGELAEPTPEDELRRRLRLAEGPVVLSVSAKRTHKNLLRLVRAFGFASRFI